MLEDESLKVMQADLGVEAFRWKENFGKGMAGWRVYISMLIAGSA